jgi:hypothetical protein
MSSRPAPDPAPGVDVPAPVDVPADDVPPSAGVDWRFLGAPDPAHARRTAEVFQRARRVLHTEPDEPGDLDAARSAFRGYLDAPALRRVERGDADTAREVWLERMVADARAGRPSVLRMTFQDCVGWGCEVPSEFVANGCFGPGVVFVSGAGDTAAVQACIDCYAAEDDDARERCRERACPVEVEGYFTGETTARPRGCEEGAHRFHILRARGGRSSPPTLVLPGGSPPPDGPPIADGPPWGVVIATAAMNQPDARARAEARQRDLVARGHAGAEVVDSRRFAGLWCCSYVVVVARFAAAADAKALVARLEREGIRGAMARKLF